jgi:hypothetical protein
MAATARMTGSTGATGSIEGVIDVRVVATNSGLHFTAFKPDGELLAVTIYGVRDAQGGYRSVMSTHGTRFHNESAQFYGTCNE